jgi:hypothetical protein
VATALAASFLIVLGQGVAAADDEGPGDKLPEPALRFAKDATLRVAEMEQDWQKLADSLQKARADFVLAERKHTDSSLRDEASRLLGAAKRLLDSQKRIPSEIERFRDALKKAASHYRTVSDLYKAYAEKTKSGEVKADYMQLAKVFESKAEAATSRARDLTGPTGGKPAGEVIEEGNGFIERLLETLSVGPVSEADCQVLAARLRKHGERCQALTLDLFWATQKILRGTGAGEGKTTSGGTTGYVPVLPQAVTGSPVKGGLDPQKVLGCSWTSPLTIQGVECRQVLRFQKDGTCTQSVYRMAKGGLGPLLGIRSYTFKLDQWGGLSVYAAGQLIEWGTITVLSEDRWVYEIAVNVGDPTRSGSRITFTRHDGR